MNTPNLTFVSIRNTKLWSCVVYFTSNTPLPTDSVILQHFLLSNIQNKVYTFVDARNIIINRYNLRFAYKKLWLSLHLAFIFHYYLFLAVRFFLHFITYFTLIHTKEDFCIRIYLNPHYQYICRYQTEVFKT